MKGARTKSVRVKAKIVKSDKKSSVTSVTSVTDISVSSRDRFWSELQPQISFFDEFSDFLKISKKVDSIMW